MSVISRLSAWWSDSNLEIDGVSLWKSALVSRRYTSRWESILLHRGVDFSAEGPEDIEIASESRFYIGLRKGAASSPEFSPSVVRIREDGTLHCPTGPAVIGPSSIITVTGKLKVGNSYINSHARIICADRIEIGDGCAIAWEVEMLDDDRHSLKIGEQPQPRTAPIVIGDRVWIGNRVTVTKGITIGDGAVVAAGSVLVDDVPERAMVGGNPAEIIAEDVSWGDRVKPIE